MFKQPVIYIQVHCGYLVARNLANGATLRKESSGLAHPRTLMGNFFEIEQLFRHAISQLNTAGLFATRPKALVHLVPEADGGYTNVEIRAFQEAAEAAGSRNAKIIWGRDPLSDNQVQEALR